MSLSAGRVGVRADQVDSHGRVISPSFLNELMEDLPEWTDLPVRVNGTEELIPSNPSVPATSPILADIDYPDERRNDQYFTYRESPTTVDGLAKIKSIKGNTLVWNQLVQNGNFADTSGWTGARGSLSVSNNALTFTATSDGAYLTKTLDVPANHKVLFIMTVSSSLSNCEASLYTDYSSRDVLLPSTTSVGTRTALITTTSIRNRLDIRVYNDATTGMPSGATATFKNVMLFDLTQMGLDVTADQFRALFPLPYYAYNSGSLLSFNGTGIKTAGNNLLKLPSSATLNGITFNVGTDGQIQITGTATAQTDFYLYGASARYDDMDIISSTYTFSCRKDSTTTGLNFFLVGLQTGTRIGVQLDNTSLSQTVALDGSDKYRVFVRVANGATINTKIALQLEFGSTATDYEPYTENTTNLPTETYFPTGMKSAGSIYDELLPTKAVTRIGAVDLGTLNWTYDASVPRFYTTGINSLINKPVNDGTKANAVSMYTNTTFNQLYATEKKNMTMAIGATGTLSIINTSYSNATAFKTAMSGVYLYYELATPVELPTLDFGE